MAAKTGGWFKESERHSLARRGVKTAKTHLKKLPSTYDKQQAERALDRVLEALTARTDKPDARGPGMTAQGLLRAGWNDELGEIERKVSWQTKPIKVRRSNFFLTEALTQAQAATALSHPDIYKYNEFDPRMVAMTLDKMGLDLGEVYIGRESSPVIYFKGASARAVAAFMKNLQKRDLYGLPDEFAGPFDTQAKKRDRDTRLAGRGVNLVRGTEANALSGLKGHVIVSPSTKNVWRLWWD